MLIEQIWTDNAYRNFNYLIACGETGEALAIDPLAHRQCLKRATELGWTITQVLNTHHHGDHTGGNRALIAATGAPLIAHREAGDRIPNVERGVGAGDVIKVGRSVELECLDTPGHTMSHICLLSHTDQPALFSGDTLFNAGAGNCHNGGHPGALYTTFAEQLSRLDETTRLYPGHEYLANNLAFTLDREPGNARAAELQKRIETMNPNDAYVTTIAEEREINTFFRLTSPEIIARLRDEFGDLDETPSPKEVFLRLRELRNSW